MIIEDLLHDAPDRRALTQLPPPEMNPLVENGALLEGQLLDVRVEALTWTVAVLVDMRLGLQIVTANTALLVVRGVTDFSWQVSGRRPGRMTAFSIIDSTIAFHDDELSLDLATSPDAALTVVGRSAEFYAGDITGGWEAPPNYTDPGVPRSHPGLAQWTTPLTLLHATRTDDPPG